MSSRTCLNYFVFLYYIIINLSCTLSYSISDLNSANPSSENNDNSNTFPNQQPTPTPPASTPPTVPGLPAITIASGLQSINSSNVNNYTISGTCSNIQVIDLNLNSTLIETAICNSGNWAVTINAVSLNDGTVTITAYHGGTTNNLATKIINKDTQIPSPPTFIVDGDEIVSTSYSSWIVWDSAIDVGSGVSHYELRLVDYLNNEVIPWINVGNILNYNFTGLSLVENQVYKAEIRAIDGVGNISATLQGDGWHVVPLGWSQQSYLKASNADANDGFGSCVGIFNDTVVVAANYEDSNQTTITNGSAASLDNSVTDSGAAYVFRRNGNNWTQEAYLKASNPGTGDSFGDNLDIYLDTIVVTAKFEDSNQTTITNGSTSSIDNSATDSGAAYVFKRNGNTWTQEAYLKPSNTDIGDLFGSSASIYGDTIVVGAMFERSNQTTITNGPSASADNSTTGAGAAYVFRRNGNTWTQEAYLKPSNTHSGDNFGSTAAIYNDTIVIGARDEYSNQTTITNGSTASSDTSAVAAGAAYVFRRTGISWTQEAYLKAPNAQTNDQFSGNNSLDIDGDTIAVGTYIEDSNQTTITNGPTASLNNSATNSGAVYIFKRSNNIWSSEAYIKASNSQAFDNFGYSLSLVNNTLVVGAISEDSNQITITNGPTASSDNSLSASGAVYIYKRSGNSWSQEAYIKAPNADIDDNFGGVVSIHGNTIVVGARNEDSNQTTITNGLTASLDNSVTNSGAAYVFVNNVPSNWQQMAYIKATNADTDDLFGSNISLDKNVLAVGARFEDSSQTTISNGPTASVDNSSANSGAVYIYRRTNSIWDQEAYIKAPNADTGDNFGFAVSLSNNTLAVSSPLESSSSTTITNGPSASADNSSLSSGAVYVLKSNGNTWTQEAYIKATNANAADLFGYTLALDNDTLAIGSILEDSSQTTITNGSTASSDNSLAASGAVYIYRRSGTSWSQEAYIKAPNANINDQFGLSIAIYGDTLVVGAAYEKSNQTTITNGPTASSDNSLTDAGAAYVFKRTGTTWTQEAFLKPSQIDQYDIFGISTAIYGDTIIIATSSDDSRQNYISHGNSSSTDNSLTNSGAVYIFKRNGTTWSQEAYIKPPQPDSNDNFGIAIALYENTLAVASKGERSNQTTITNGPTASLDNSATNSGAIYVFKRVGTIWSQEAFIKPSNSNSSQSFGNPSISENTLAVGAPNEDSNQTTITNGPTASSDTSTSNSGAVYIFQN